MQPSSRRVFVFAPILTILALSLAVSPLTAQTQTQTQKPAPKPAPAQVKPPQTKPAPAKPAPTAAPVKPAPEPSTPAPPPPQDIRFKSTYTAGELTTETVTFIKGERERFEFQDMVLLKQRDQKRTVQISRAANTYLVAPEGMPAAAPGAPPKPPGVVMVATTIVDTGERKTAFGQQARHVKVAIDRQPMAGACDATKQRVEIDGWYIDAPGAIASQAGPEAPQNAGGCADQIQSTSNGEPKALGFPIAYTSTMTGDDGKPVTAKMEVTEFELTTLDPALFEIRPA
jgi:hypothetical protein